MKWNPDKKLILDARDLRMIEECARLQTRCPDGTNPNVFLLRFVTYALSIDPNNPDLHSARQTLLKKLREEGLSPFREDPEEKPF